MPKAYFEPEVLTALGEVLQEARAILARRGEDSPADLDWTAKRILDLASQGLPPWLILSEVIRPLSPKEAGIPQSEITVADEPSRR